MAYAAYEFYRDTYHGKAIAEADFPWLAGAASAYLDAVTYGKAATYTQDDKVKLAACALADVYKKSEEGGEVISQTVGKWTQTKASPSKTEAQRLYDTAKLYLAGTGLLSRCLP